MKTCSLCKRELPKSEFRPIFSTLCRGRLRKMMWVLCEIPDHADIERVEALYGLSTLSV